MTSPFARFVCDMDLNAPASPWAIAQAERDLGIRLPEDFKAFLGFANGGEGAIGEKGWLALWRVEDLIENHRGYNVQTYFPGVLLFGSDGSGNAFALRAKSAPVSYLMAPFIGLGPDEALSLADDFEGFLRVIFEGREFEAVR